MLIQEFILFLCISCRFLSTYFTLTLNLREILDKLDNIIIIIIIIIIIMSQCYFLDCLCFCSGNTFLCRLIFLFFPRFFFCLIAFFLYIFSFVGLIIWVESDTGSPSRKQASGQFLGVPCLIGTEQMLYCPSFCLYVGRFIIVCKICCC